MVKLAVATHCPCGSGLAYRRCCVLWHEGAPAPTAEALMRSRYSAYVLKLNDYLLATWHESTRPESLEDSPTRWLGLEVKQHAQQDATHATVEFVARSKQGGHANRLHEISRFERLAGRWTYLDGNNFA